MWPFILMKGDIYGIVGIPGKSTLVRVINLLQVPCRNHHCSWVWFIRSGDLGGNVPFGRNVGISEWFSNTSTMKAPNDCRRKCSIYVNILNWTKEQKEWKWRNCWIWTVYRPCRKLPSTIVWWSKQRVAIACHLPTIQNFWSQDGNFSLGSKTTKQILALLQKVKQKLGFNHCLDLHEIQIIKRYCQSVAVMQNGRWLKKGLFLDIFSNRKMLWRKTLSRLQQQNRWSHGEKSTNRSDC